MPPERVKRMWLMIAATVLFLLVSVVLLSREAPPAVLIVWLLIYGHMIFAIFMMTRTAADKLVGKWGSKPTDDLPPLVIEFMKDGTLVIERGRAGDIDFANLTKTMLGSYRLIDDKKLEMTIEDPPATFTEKVVSSGGGELVLTFEGKMRTFLPWATIQARRGFSSLISSIGITSETKSKRDLLIGRWESTTGAGLWFIFTPDGAMLRQDGLATKYRWLDGDTVELFEGGGQATILLKVLSVGESELLLKIGEESGHFYRTPTITEAIEKKKREEAEQAMREFAAGAAKVAGGVAAVLAIGGLAVLCGAAATAGSGGSGGSGSSSERDFREVRCDGCNGKGYRGTHTPERCFSCGGHGVIRIRA